MAITLDGTNGITSPDFEPSSSTTPTNGLFLPAANTVGLATGSTERLRIDSSGNLGLGVTPSAWWSTIKVFQGANGGALTFNSGAPETSLLSNGYYNGSNWIYSTSSYASRYAVNGYNGTHTWFNAPSGTAGNAISFTQAMTLDASGNLGIGTSSPQSRLNVYSSSAGGAVITLSDGTLGVTFGGQFKGYGTTGVGGFAEFGSLDGGTYSRGFIVGQQASYLGFYTGSSITSTNTERARIDSSGNLLVGTTSNLYGSRLNVKSAGDIVAAEFYRQGTAGGSAIVVFNSNATATESLRSYIDTSSGNLTVVSDERVKDNIEDIEYGLSEVLALRPVSFKWKNSFDEQVNLGFIAQEVEQVISNVVTTLTEDISHTLSGQKMMDKEALIPVLVKAIQELNQRLEALENK